MIGGESTGEGRERRPAAPTFSEAQLAGGPSLQALYPDPQGALLPALHLRRSVSVTSRSRPREYVAGLSPLAGHVHEVVTFYTLYFRERPGRHVVSVCHNLSCHLAAARSSLNLKTRLGVAPARRTRRPRDAALGRMPLRVRAAPMMQSTIATSST